MFPFRRNVLAFAALLALSSPVIAGKLAIVIDDFGYRPHNENQVLAMPSAISVAVLPDSPHAREMATKAHNSGHEVLIHLPMAPLSKQPLEKNTGILQQRYTDRYDGDTERNKVCIKCQLFR